MNPHKRTTKVNFGMIAAVVVFFALAAWAIVWFNAHPEKAVPKVEQSAR
ncbi:MAG: hypothetical protein ABI222_12955 [Opitutaceae bacterium]